jgi:MYXO-CTERM domain-containing protein
MTARVSLRAVLHRGVLVGLLAMAAAGCSSGPRGEAKEHSRQDMAGGSRNEIVGGTTSTTAQDATVLVALGQGSCTGTLIAPNLVLTARHCVAEPKGQSECTQFGPTQSASTVSIHVGVGAKPTGTPVAKGAKITVPTTNSTCGFDIALVQLDRAVPNAKIAPVRFTTLAPNEPATAVGYGVGGNDEDRPSRMQRSTTVLGVGPQAITYTTKQKTPIKYDIPNGDLATGESTCYGDSGGPLFDAQGRVIGVTSRGIFDYPENGAHGNGCIDLPSVYASTRMNEATIRQAAQAAGHPLEEAQEPAGDGVEEEEDEGDLEPQSEDDDEIFDDDTSDEDEDEEDEDETPKKKRKRRVTMQSSGCSLASEGDPFPWLPALGIIVAFGAVRRRRG